MSTKEARDQLVQEVRRRWDKCEIVLTGRQSKWLEDLLDQAEAGKSMGFNEASVGLLTRCAEGWYSSPMGDVCW